ncbi:helix-turn-helix domain-containing protein [Desulfofundulus thermocisternus]|uniref:helix-turn-helix domain-containing protein n=1 Tax=Desulfofundulus thermocisternus TaxID=42471 RepID=UPI00217E6E0A|nr:helix-turn-helix transcriptional regulator [Desulfofundulus thermocisternus]MCS5695262.1 helix-turn-helix domain-containing protein [Desulfofundulus thermocisternus]
MTKQERDYWSGIRRMKRITLEKLAKELKCSRSLLSMFENNQCDMSDEKIEAYKKIISNYKQN